MTLCPTDKPTIKIDPTKAKQKLGWVSKITLDELLQELVPSGLASAKKCPAQAPRLRRKCECIMKSASSPRTLIVSG